MNDYSAEFVGYFGIKDQAQLISVGRKLAKVLSDLYCVMNESFLNTVF